MLGPFVCDLIVFLKAFNLFHYGYTCDEIEEMLVDHSLLREALKDVKFIYGEDVYESYCGAF